MILYDYGATIKNDSYEKLKISALEFPRYSFRVTMSNLAKLLKKTWCGKIVENCIFEKPRRKSSANSKKSSENSTDPAILGTNGRSRLDSLDEADKPVQISEDTRARSNSFKDGMEHSAKFNSLVQVDDPIDEQEEIDRDTKKKKKNKKK